MSKPGVGYEVLPGARSHAGGRNEPMNLNADPWAGLADPRTTVVDPDVMARRYGPHWAAGVPGVHSNVYEDALREKFATRTAMWTVEYEEWDGNPIGHEVNDAYYSQDNRVTSVTTGTCQQQLAATQQTLTTTQQALATAQQALQASQGEVAALTGLVVRLREIPPDILDTVKELRKLKVGTGLKAAIRRLEQWILLRKTI